MPKLRIPTGSVLGTFSKGNENSLSLNFGVSGGRNCDTGCAHHPQNDEPDMPKDCYAHRAEHRHDRKSQLAKLLRHERMPSFAICGRALMELQALRAKGVRIDWLRISTNSAVPAPEEAKSMQLFKTQFRALLAYCAQQGIKVHFPVETADKQEFYAWLASDLGVTVRESVHIGSVDDWRQFIDNPRPCSTSVGAGLPLVARIELASELAAKRRQSSGRYTAVCPAVVASTKLKLARGASKA